MVRAVFLAGPPSAGWTLGPGGSTEPRGTHISILSSPLSRAPQNCFELYIPDSKDQVIKACKTEADGRVVEGNHTVYRISAPTAEEKDEWMKSVK